MRPPAYSRFPTGIGLVGSSLSSTCWLAMPSLHCLPALLRGTSPRSSGTCARTLGNQEGNHLPFRLQSKLSMARNKQKASDADLQVFLSGLAESERGLRFRVIGSKEVGTMLALTDFPRSGNPVYEFSFLDSTGDPATAVAYTNIVDSSKRVATRADALGKAIAAAGPSFFELNPFLLIFDYKEKRCMAVSGAALFAVFEKATTSEELPTPAYGFFSMSPHFGNQTISMYGEVPSSSLHCFAADSVPSSLSSGELRKLTPRHEVRDRSVRRTYP